MDRPLEPAGLEERGQANGIPQTEAPGEQMAHQFRSVVADRDAQQGMDAEQTGQVSGILGERRAAA